MNTRGMLASAAALVGTAATLATSATAQMVAVRASGTSEPAAAAAQPLSLIEAFKRADRNAFGNRIAAAEAGEAASRRTAALRGVLPAVRAEAGFIRTTDPIAVFGTTLRQRRIDAADFDPHRLNYPRPVTNHAGALIVEQPVFNMDAHLGRAAAASGLRAADALTEWSASGTRVDVVRAYFGAVLAQERAITLEQADKAARSHLTQADKMVAAGLVTRSDALLAAVKAGEIEAQLLEAHGEVGIARRQLAVVLGTPHDTAFVLPPHLPSVARVHELLTAEVAYGPTERADLDAARHGLRAATADARRALSLYLPRINGFARYDWNSENGMYGGPEAWSFGVLATWSPFAGAAELAERAAAGARKRVAEARLDVAQAQAGLEIARAGNQRKVALKRLDVAQRAAAQSAEAHRIVSAKYEGGLATITDLLDAAAVETQSALALSAARYDGIIVEAGYERALGSDLNRFPTLLTVETAKNGP